MEEVQVYKDVFAVIDEDGSGAISTAELKRFVNWTDGRTDRWRNGRLKGRTDGGKDGRTDGRTDGRPYTRHNSLVNDAVGGTGGGSGVGPFQFGLLGATYVGARAC